MDESKKKFLKKVRITSSCWLWTGNRRGKGYGSFYSQGKHLSTHRVSYAFFNGEIPEGVHVLHHCDNRLCVRPSHLFLGSNEDNLKDMCLKNRQCKGEDKPSNVLTEQDVINIRSIGSSMSSRSIGQIYGIHHSTVLSIRKGKKWKYLLEEKELHGSGT